MVGYRSLGHVGLTYQISAKKIDTSYVKQVSHSRYGLEMPNPHDLITAEITEAQEEWFSEGVGCNIVWNSLNHIYIMVYTIFNR